MTAVRLNSRGSRATAGVYRPKYSSYTTVAVKNNNTAYHAFRKH